MHHSALPIVLVSSPSKVDVRLGLIILTRYSIRPKVSSWTAFDTSAATTRAI